MVTLSRGLVVESASTEDPLEPRPSPASRASLCTWSRRERRVDGAQRQRWNGSSHLPGRSDDGSGVPSCLQGEKPPVTRTYGLSYSGFSRNHRTRHHHVHRVHRFTDGTNMAARWFSSRNTSAKRLADNKKSPVPQAVKPWVQRPIRKETESPERLITGPDGIVHASRTYWAVEALTLCGVRLPNHGAGRKVKSPTCIGCLAA